MLRSPRFGQFAKCRESDQRTWMSCFGTMPSGCRHRPFPCHWCLVAMMPGSVLRPRRSGGPLAGRLP